MPFIGNISGCPSVLEGDIDELVAEAQEHLKKGVYGFDLLGYRYTGDAESLIHTFATVIAAPVCIAGSINSYERLDIIKDIKPWAFTIGGAFFENKFGEDFSEQIDEVCH